MCFGGNHIISRTIGAYLRDMDRKGRCEVISDQKPNANSGRQWVTEIESRESADGQGPRVCRGAGHQFGSVELGPRRLGSRQLLP